MKLEHSQLRLALLATGLAVTICACNQSSSTAATTPANQSNTSSSSTTGSSTSSTSTTGSSSAGTGGSSSTGSPTSTSSAGAPAALLMTQQTSQTISLSWDSPAGGKNPVAYYKIYRNGTAYAQVSGTSYMDSEATNATEPSFLEPATDYSYAVSAVDTQGNESAKAYPSVYFYRNGAANQGAVDYSYGITESWQSAGGSPVGAGNDISLSYPAGGGGFQPFSNVPLAPVYDLEIGSFKYLTLDVKVTDTAHDFFISHISRLPPGDVYPRAWVSLSSYCTPVVGQWVTCKIPLSALSIGSTNFTASISGNQLTVTSVQSGVGVDAGGFISGPGIPAGTYIVGTPGGITYNSGLPPGNGLGTYTLGGPGISSSTYIASESMLEQRTALYKVDFGLHSGTSGTTVYLNNIGWTTN